MVSSVVRVLAVAASVGVLGMVVACAPSDDADLSNVNNGLEAQCGGLKGEVCNPGGDLGLKDPTGGGRTPVGGKDPGGKGGGNPFDGIDTTGFEKDKSNCVGIKIEKIHNIPDGLTIRDFHNIRIAPIKRSTRTDRDEVPCVWTHDDQYPVSSCEFNVATTKLMWAEGFFNGFSARYAIAGQFTHITDAVGGKAPKDATTDWVIGTITQQVQLQSGGNAVAAMCADGGGADVSGTGTSDELASACTSETFNVTTNAAGGQMDNYATIPVCSTSNSASDVGEVATSTTAAGTPPPAGSKCVLGEGAGLNAANGTERNSAGAYLSGSHRCHVATSSGVEIYSAKRPATRAYPAAVDMLTPTWWRPTSPLKIAN